MASHKDYIDYYVNQAGSGVSSVYHGSLHQKGYGIGSFLGGLFRSVLPLLKSGARAVGKEMLRTGGNIISDVTENKPLRISFKRRMDEAGQNLNASLVSKVNRMTGSGYKRPRALETVQFLPLPAPKRTKQSKRTTSRSTKKKSIRSKRKGKLESDIFS